VGVARRAAVDRQRQGGCGPLPDPAPVPASAAGEAGAAPRTATEAQLVTIWEGVLQRAGVGMHDNFFALGGDSIRSLQVIAWAGRVGLRLTPRQLFERQTIAELAVVVATAPGVQGAWLREAVAAAQAAQEALRLQVRDDAGTWTQHLGGRPECRQPSRRAAASCRRQSN
jgi:aryl carrier-like protein